MGKVVLATITRTNGVFSLQPQTMPFHSCNKSCHMIQVRRIQPQCLVHPFSVHDRESLHTQIVKMAHISRGVQKKSSQVALDLISLLHMDLDLDLEKRHQIMEKREDWGFESENQPLAVPPFNKFKRKISSPRKWPVFRVLRSKPEKI
jgi:hypothetical protein